MHYYKRNLGDYAKKAGRLSMLQHGSYTLLIDACYDREEFPTLEQAIEWTWASTTEEVEAVTFVLRKFFTLENGVYVQKRIQEEIAEYQAKAETNQRIAIERETKRKEKGTSRKPVVHEPPPNQEPITKNHKPITKSEQPTSLAPNPENQKPTPAGLVCKSLVSAGIASCSPSHPKLLALLAAGAELEEFSGAAGDCVKSGKTSFAYLLGVVEGRRRDAKQLAEGIKHGKLAYEKPWYLINSAIEEKAAKHDPPIVRGREEHYPDFRARILEAYQITPEMVEKAKKESEVMA